MGATKSPAPGPTRLSLDPPGVERVLSEPELAGDCIVAERAPDGSVHLVPDTSDEAIAARLGLGGRPMTQDEFSEHFGALPRDDEG